MKSFKKIISHIIGQLKEKLSHKQFIFLSAVFVGVSVGIVSIILKLILHTIFNFVNENRFIKSQFYYAILPVTGILLTVLVLKYFYRNSNFKGLPSLYRAIKKKSSIIPKNQMHLQIVTSSLTVGFGGSAGVEAPIVLTGAAYGSNFARTYSLNYNDRTLLLACGVSAGIGATFNAPIAGVLFALEVLLIDLGITAFIPLIIASASGAIISKIILGSSILLSFENIKTFDYKNLLFYILLGVFAGLVSVYHARIYIKIENYFHRSNFSIYSKVLIGGAFLALLILIFPTLYGEGFESIKWLSTNNELKVFSKSIFESYLTNKWLIIAFVGLIIFFKAIASGLTIGSGGNGGNFAPSLFVGAYLGFVFSRLINHISIWKLPESNFILVGMAGILSGLYHAPLTSIFLIAEMTGGYTLMIPLMIVSSISFAISKYFEPLSMDLKKIHKDGEKVINNKDIEILSNIQISNLVESNYPNISPDYTLGELIEVIKSSNRYIFPVVDNKGMFQGIILIDHIKEVMFKIELFDLLKVKEIMVVPSVLATSSASLEEVLRKMEENNYWFLPVVDNNKFKGFISKNAILTNYRQKLKETIID